ncbi:MAG: sulfatase [Verrucomicrobia bacterium]|nr:sulfatase [Verrucomicrobiota bacterium]
MILLVAGNDLLLLAADRPNILLVLSDDHSAAHVGCYGNKDIKTPNLDRFAAQGMRFDRAYVTCPQCVPSRASLMTGQSPVRIAMTRFSAPLPADVITYPELLRAQGYFTGVAGRTYHLDGSQSPPESRSVFDARELRTFHKRLDFVKTAGNGPAILSQFREFLELAPKSKPFFLQLCFSDPHRPLDRNAIPQPHDPAKLRLPPHYPDTPGVRDDFARYYDEIARFDGDFGRVLEELEKRGLVANTLVVFMGDNGASQFRGKGTLYEFGVRVPLIARWPGHVKPGSTTAELISGEDLAPTFLQAVGVAAANEMTGRSFLKLLAGQPVESRKYVFAERGAHGSGLPNNSAAFDLGRCVITKTHKLIYTALWQLPYWPVDFAGDAFWKELQQMHQDGKLDSKLDRLYFSPARPMFELYDLVNDPNEFNNLIGKPEAADIQGELKAALQEWMILQRDYLPLPVPPPPRQRVR